VKGDAILLNLPSNGKTAARSRKRGHDDIIEVGSKGDPRIAQVMGILSHVNAADVEKLLLSAKLFNPAKVQCPHQHYTHYSSIRHLLDC
jgi:hypothetical protein